MYYYPRLDLSACPLNRVLLLFVFAVSPHHAALALDNQHIMADNNGKEIKERSPIHLLHEVTRGIFLSFTITT